MVCATVMFSDFDQAAHGVRSLRQGRGPDIQRQYVRVAGAIPRLPRAAKAGIEPCTGRDNQYARRDAVGQAHAGQHTAARIAYLNHLPVGNAALRGILRMHRQRLMSGSFIGLNGRGCIQLAVQPVGRLH